MSKVTNFTGDDFALQNLELSDSDSENSEIEREFRGLINPNALNKRYQTYKQSLAKTTRFEEEEGVEAELEQEEEGEVKQPQYKKSRTPEPPLFERFLKLILPIFRNSYKLLIFVGLLLINLFIINYIYSKSGIPQNQIIPSVSSFGDISKSLQHLQWQINDLNTKNKNRLHDFKNYLDLKIDEFNVKFTQIDKELTEIHERNDDILTKLEGLNLNDVEFDSSRIPILLDDHKNVKMLPELEEYLHDYIKSILSNDESKARFQIDHKELIEKYSNEIINSKIGFMNKDEILSLITLQFQENKKKLIEEIKSLTKLNKKAETENIIPKRLLSYTNDQNIAKNEKINYSLASSGARIINYLTSETFKPKFKESSSIFGSLLSSFYKQDSKAKGSEDVSELDQLSYTSSPFIILTSHDGYWRSSKIKDTQVAIKFLEPIYITRLTYDHRRPINGALLTSAPYHFQVYVQSDSNEEILTLEENKFKETNGKYVKIGEYEYDLNRRETEQDFEVPKYIKRYLIRSILIKVDDNYGNEFFTSLYKFKIEGLTRFDIYSIKQLMQNDEIGDSIKGMFRDDYRHKKIGDDEYV